MLRGKSRIENLIATTVGKLCAKLPLDLPQSGTTAWTGKNRVGRNLIATGWAVEPMLTRTALLFGEPLLLLALRAATIHFTVTQIVFKK